MNIFDVMVKRAAVINPKIVKPPKLNAKMPSVSQPSRIALPRVTASSAVPLVAKVKDMQAIPKTMKGTQSAGKKPFALKQTPNWGERTFMKGVKK